MASGTDTDTEPRDVLVSLESQESGSSERRRRTRSLDDRGRRFTGPWSLLPCIPLDVPPSDQGSFRIMYFPPVQILVRFADS